MSVVYGIMAAVFGLMSGLMIFAGVKAAWRRNWKFAGGALLLGTIVFFEGALRSYEASQGRGWANDPTIPRIR